MIIRPITPDLYECRAELNGCKYAAMANTGLAAYRAVIGMMTKGGAS